MSARTARLLFEAAGDLEALALPNEANFNMAVWGEHLYTHEPEFNDYCGTSACAAGWLSLIPKWRRRGLASRWVRKYGAWTLVPLTSVSWSIMVMKVFGINESEVVNLFESIDDERDKKPQVVERLRRMARYYEKWETDIANSN